MAEVATTLNEALFAQLQQEKLTLLHTIDAESGAPTSSAISWIYAKDPETIRFALDQRSRLIGNMKQNPAISMTIFAANTVNIVLGKAAVVAETLDEVPFKLTCFDVSIETVRDGMFYGARISTEPEYEKTYDKRAADKLDQQVFAAMRKA